MWRGGIRLIAPVTTINRRMDRGSLKLVARVAAACVAMSAGRCRRDWCGRCPLQWIRYSRSTKVRWRSGRLPPIGGDRSGLWTDQRVSAPSADRTSLSQNCRSAGRATRSDTATPTVARFANRLALIANDFFPDRRDARQVSSGGILPGIGRKGEISVCPGFRAKGKMSDT